jgi:IPT/TIG domain
VKVGHRLSIWIFCATIVAALPVVGPVTVAAASSMPDPSPSAVPTHEKLFLAETASARAAASRSHALKRAGSQSVRLHAIGQAAPLSGGQKEPTHAALPVVATQTDEVAAFPGASQALDITAHGGDQALAPPDTDIASGPTDVVTTVNSTIDVFSRTGATLLGSDDINTFMSVDSAHSSSDPRIVYDASSQRWWLTITEVANNFSCSGIAAPVLIAVSASSNPLPFSGWLVYELPFVTPNTFLGDQPGLGVSNNTVTVTFNDYNCSNTFLGSDIDILQKTDLEHDSGVHANAPFTDGSFAPQPAQSFGSTATQYVVANDSDCAPSVCTTPVIEVDAFTGTPEAQNVAVTQHLLPMTPTVVDNTSFSLPPAQQSGTATTINTDDDRILNAVWENGVIWTAGGTECTPSMDSAPRSCLDYVEVTASSTGVVNSTITQINNVGVKGSYLYYPAVSVDSAGDLFTVFDESSSSTFPTIVSSTIPSGGSALSTFQTVHASTTFYDPPSGVCQTIASTKVCRWGDYSGAAQDPSNPKDVWVVSEAEDGAMSTACTPASLCWGSDVALLTLASPVITSLNVASGPVAGGETVTVSGTDFGLDTSATFNGSPIAITSGSLTATSFRIVTPPSGPSGGTAQVQATDALGASAETAASLYTYIGLANYAPVTPFRILDTRNTGGPIGQGLIRAVQVTGLGTIPVPTSASAAVLNVTEVVGSASSLLTVYPYGSVRPTASNLNFGAQTVIANLVTVTLGAHSGQGWINIYNAVGSVNVVVDVEGYFTTAPATTYQGLFHPIAPVRVCDTRSSCDGHGVVGAGQSIVVTVASAGGIPSNGTAEAAVVNLTGVVGSAATYLSLSPTNPDGTCSFTGTSTINLAAGAVVANRVMVELGPTSPSGQNDALCVFNAAGTINVLVDANGWYGSSTITASPPGYQYQPLPPTRICDTRFASTSCDLGAIGGGVSRLIRVAGNAGVPAFSSSTKVVAMVANLTAVLPSAGTYMTLYPANLARPIVSDVNVNAAEVLPNLAVVQLDTIPSDAHDGQVYLYNSVGSVNAIIDLEGWFQ